MDSVKRTMQTVALWSTASLVGAGVIHTIAHWITTRGS